MATVTGTLADFGLNSLASFSPQIVFTPSSAAVGGVAIPYLLATQPRVVIPASDGSFTATLVHTDILRGAKDIYYSIRIEWLDSAGNFVHVDFPDWKLYVPAAGGTIVDLIQAPWNPALVWVGPTPPGGQPTNNTFWLDTETGNLNRWAA